jgi:hypothetical protein
MTAADVMTTVTCAEMTRPSATAVRLTLAGAVVGKGDAGADGEG